MKTPPLARRIALAAFATLAAGLAPQARAAITCSLSGTSLDITYSQGTLSQTAGSVTLSCSRLTTDANTQNYWVQMNNSDSGSRNLLRHGGTNTAANRLAFDIRKGSTTTSWTSNGGNRVSGTLNFAGATTASVSLPFTWRIASQTGKTAGIYDAIMTASLQLTSNGAIVATDSFTLTASVPTQCFVGQVGSGYTAPGAVSPATLVLNYTSFSPTAQTATMDFTVDCTLGTPYTLSLSPASGTLLGLDYSLSLSQTSNTGNGQAQGYTVTGTIPADQSGTCATSAAACTASQPTTITLTY